MLTNEEVNIREVAGIDEKAIQEKWKYFIQYPVDIRCYLWPIDAVALPNGNYGLIFRKRAFPKLEPLKKVLYNPEALYWKNSGIQTLIKNLLNAFNILHQGGYAYHAFDIEKMYYNESTNDVLIDFSLGMSRHMFEVQYASVSSFDDVRIEFLPPWVSINDTVEMSLEDDYYSIAAMLFRLMIGRMPYQGRHMDGMGYIMDRQRDIDQGSHIQMFEHYRNNPVFIFDEDDTSNNIGLYSHEEKIIDKWDELPAEIKKMFIDVFGKANITAERGKRKLYSVQEWTDALETAHIINKEVVQ